LVSKEVINWLLEVEDPSLRYRTLTEILDKSSKDIEVLNSGNQIVGSVAAKSIFEKMHPNGYWLQKNPRSGEVLGDGVVYGAFGTTHFVLSYLAELGLDRNHPLVNKAVLRYLGLQRSDGDFYGHFSCLLGLNIRTFVMLGYKDDARVQKSIDLLLNTHRDDGGYLCDIHEGKYKTKQAKSCIRGSVKALLAFSYLPELWDNTRVIKLVNYFLSHDGIFKTTNLNELVNKDMQRNSFPITWRANIFEILLALSKMGYGKNIRLKRAWRIMDEKRDSQGRVILDWNPMQSPWKVGKRNQPNKWLTFYSILAHKFKEKN
jgi:hypothetical protein